MQYILVSPDKIRDRKFREKMPDGRVILPFTELKTYGVMEDITIVSSGKVLKNMIRRQNESGIYDPTTPEDVDGDFSVDPPSEDGEVSQLPALPSDEDGDETPVAGSDGTDTGDGEEGDGTQVIKDVEQKENIEL